MSAPEEPAPLPSETLNLALEAQRGDRQVFAELYERLTPAVSAWAILRIGPWLRPHFDSQDMVQEVWARALKALGNFEPGRVRFRAWIFSIAKNVLREAIRKHGRLERADGPGQLAGLEDDDATTASRQVARAESTLR